MFYLVKENHNFKNYISAMHGIFEFFPCSCPIVVVHLKATAVHLPLITFSNVHRHSILVQNFTSTIFCKEDIHQDGCTGERLPKQMTFVFP